MEKHFIFLSAWLTLPEASCTVFLCQSHFTILRTDSCLVKFLCVFNGVVFQFFPSRREALLFPIDFLPTPVTSANHLIYPFLIIIQGGQEFIFMSNVNGFSRSYGPFFSPSRSLFTRYAAPRIPASSPHLAFSTLTLSPIEPRALFSSSRLAGSIKRSQASDT